MSKINTIKFLLGVCTEAWNLDFGQQDILLGLSRETIAIAENSSDLK